MNNKSNSTKKNRGKQFLVEIACKQKIHRPQGLTLDGLAFDHIGVNSHGLVYIALPHFRDMYSLFMIYPLTRKNFKVKEKIINKMNQLNTDAKWKLSNNKIQTYRDNSITILSLNTRSLTMHIDDNISEYNFLHADIICLQETHTTQKNYHENLKMFEVVSMYHIH